jgi:hypothetical protein
MKVWNLKKLYKNNMEIYRGNFILIIIIIIIVLPSLDLNFNVRFKK